MLGGIAGSILGGSGSLSPLAPSVQGGFIGNSGGLASRFPLGAFGEITDLNKQLIDQMKENKSFGLAGAVASNIGGGTPLGNAGGMGAGMGVLNDPMTIKKLY